MLKNVEKNDNFIKSADAKCDYFKWEVRTRVRAHLNFDVRGACVRPKKRSQLTPWLLVSHCDLLTCEYLSRALEFFEFMTCPLNPSR